MTPQEKRESLKMLRELVGRIEVGGKRPPGFTKAQRKAVWERAEGKCEVCGDELQPGWPIDHVKEWADGGAHDLSNWAAKCKPCHRDKSAKSVSARAKPNRIRKREAEGAKESKIKGGRKLQSRGFDKTKKRTFGGKVVSRT